MNSIPNNLYLYNHQRQHNKFKFYCLFQWLEGIKHGVKFEKKSSISIKSFEEQFNNQLTSQAASKWAINKTWSYLSHASKISAGHALTSTIQKQHKQWKRWRVKHGHHDINNTCMETFARATLLGEASPSQTQQWSHV